VINWSSYNFHPVVFLPSKYSVLDLSGDNVNVKPETDFWIGRYNEIRKNLYSAELFEGIRNIHVGIDIGAPVGTPCMSFSDGVIKFFGYNPQIGDYGNVIITEHEFDSIYLWALYGHLDSKSIQFKKIGQPISRGEVIGHMGNQYENGGWPSHLHFQLSFIEPATHDLPGVVSADEHFQSLQDFPDPRLVLGALY